MITLDIHLRSFARADGQKKGAGRCSDGSDALSCLCDADASRLQDVLARVLSNW